MLSDYEIFSILVPIGVIIMFVICIIIKFVNHIIQEVKSMREYKQRCLKDSKTRSKENLKKVKDAVANGLVREKTT